MFALCVCQSFSEVGNGVVQRQETNRQLRLFGLFLLVLGRTFLGSPLILLHLIHLVERRHFAHPGLNNRVYRTFAACEVACDVADEVQALLLSVNVERNPCGQRSDAGANGRHNWHSE